MFRKSSPHQKIGCVSQTVELEETKHRAPNWLCFAEHLRSPAPNAHAASLLYDVSL